MAYATRTDLLRLKVHFCHTLALSRQRNIRLQNNKGIRDRVIKTEPSSADKGAGKCKNRLQHGQNSVHLPVDSLIVCN